MLVWWCFQGVPVEFIVVLYVQFRGHFVKHSSLIKWTKSVSFGTRLLMTRVAQIPPHRLEFNPTILVLLVRREFENISIIILEIRAGGPLVFPERWLYMVDLHMKPLVIEQFSQVRQSINSSNYLRSTETYFPHSSPTCNGKISMLKKTLLIHLSINHWLNIL